MRLNIKKTLDYFDIVANVNNKICLTNKKKPEKSYIIKVNENVIGASTFRVFFL